MKHYSFFDRQTGIDLEATEDEEGLYVLRSEVEVTTARLNAVTDALAISERRLADAEQLVRNWSNFDFDCPDEYNEDTDEDEEDGWALGQLYEATEKFFSSSVSVREDKDEEPLSAGYQWRGR